MRLLSFVGLFAAVAAFAAQDIVLRRTLTPNTSEEYSIKTLMTTVVQLPNGMGEQEMSLDAEQTYGLKLGKIEPSKGAAVTATTSFSKFQTDGLMGASAEKPKPVTQKGWIDEQGRIKLDLPKKKDAPGDLLSGGDVSSLVSPFIELPAGPVHVGGSWDITIPKNGFMKADQKLVATLTGEKELKGKKAWVVTLAGELAIDSGVFKLPKQTAGQPNPVAGQKAQVKATMKVKGEALLDKDSGQTLHMESTTDSKQQAELPDLGLTIKSSSFVRMTVDKV